MATHEPRTTVYNLFLVQYLPTAPNQYPGYNPRCTIATQDKRYHQIGDIVLIHVDLAIQKNVCHRPLSESTNAQCRRTVEYNECGQGIC